jgi:hypothetical protein
MRNSWALKRVVLAASAAAGLCCAAPAHPPAARAKPAPAQDAPPSEALPARVRESEPIAPEPSPPEPPPRRPGAYANIDPSDDFIVGPPEPLADCDEQLARAGVKFIRAALPVHTEGRPKMVCGAAQVVTYLRGPGKIAYNTPPVLTCTMALALAWFETIIEEEAARILHARVVRIEQLGTYACRVVPRFPTTVSEHSYANALDLGRMVLENGKTVEVFRDFDRGDADPKTPAGAFLRAISRRANDEDVFSHVLTPFFDSAHSNHFHLDLARFRRDGTRPQQE